jgi:hypothetical protein
MMAVGAYSAGRQRLCKFMSPDNRTQVYNVLREWLPREKVSALLYDARMPD